MNPTTHPAKLEDLMVHARFARDLARRLVSDQAAADDVVQELWLAGLNAPPQIDRPVKPWIAGVVRHLARRLRRDNVRRTRREAAAAKPEHLTPCDEPVARAEAHSLLVAAVLSLEEPFRSTVLLRYFDGLEPAEIAVQQHLPAGTVRWRLAAARERLRAILARRHGGEAAHWCRALLPIALSGPPRRGVLLTTQLFGGVLTMKFLAEACALMILLLVGWLVWNAAGVPHSEPVPEFEAVAAGRPTDVDANSALVGGQVAVDRGQRTGIETSDLPGPVPDGTPPPIAQDIRATLRLRCVDEQGRALEGIQMQFNERRAQPPVSDANGRLEYELKLHAPRVVAIQLSLEHPEFARVTQMVTVEPGAAMELGDVVFSPGATVRGRVVDEVGAPVADALVSSQGRGLRVHAGGGLYTENDHEGTGRAKVATGTDGSFALTGLHLGPETLHAELGSHTSPVWLSGAVKIEVTGSGLADIEIPVRSQARPEREIRVRVLDPDGQPVPHAAVRLMSRSASSSSMVDGEGRIVFRPDSNPPFRLEATDPEDRHLPAIAEGVQLGADVDLRFPPVRSGHFVLQSPRTRLPSMAQIELRPLPSAGSIFGGRSGGRSLGSESVTISEDGRGTFRVPPGRFEMVVQVAGHLAASSPALDAEALPDPVLIRLTPCRQVSGLVLDPAGVPVPGAEVSLYLLEQHRRTVNGFPVWLERDPAACTRSDAEGRFVLDWQAGRPACVQVWTKDRGIAETEVLAAGTEDVQRDIRLLPGAVIEGHLRGRATPAGAVVALSRGDGKARTVRVAADGSYRFQGLLPGNYLVTLRERELSPHEWSSRTSIGPAYRSVPTNCTVLPGGTTVHDLWDAEGEPASLQFHLQVPGLDLEGTVVQVAAVDTAIMDAPRSQSRATLDADGRAQLTGLTDGRHHITVRGTYGQQVPVLLDAFVDLKQGSNRFEVLAPSTGTVVVKDLPADRTSTGAVHLMMFLACEVGEATLRFPLSGAGTIRMSHVPAGAVRLERGATVDEIHAALLAGSEQAESMLTVVRTFTVPAGGTVEVSY